MSQRYKNGYPGSVLGLVLRGKDHARNHSLYRLLNDTWPYIWGAHVYHRFHLRVLGALCGVGAICGALLLPEVVQDTRRPLLGVLSLQFDLSGQGWVPVQGGLSLLFDFGPSNFVCTLEKLLWIDYHRLQVVSLGNSYLGQLTYLDGWLLLFEVV